MVKYPQMNQSDTPITRSIRQQIFKIPLLPQEKIVEKFETVDAMLYPYCLKLTETFPRMRLYFQEVIFRIASGNTFGKNYFDKEDREDTPAGKKKKKGAKKVLFKKSEIRVLQQSFSLLRPGQSPAEFIDSARRAGFIRGVFEEGLELFFDLTNHYPEWVAEMMRVKTTDPDRYVQLEKKVHQVEDELNFYDREKLVVWAQETIRIWKLYKVLRDEIISPYFRLIYTLAKGTSTSDAQTLDNFQNGVFGLIRAMKCYTPSRFAAFSLVATMWIRQSILLNLKNEINFIKLPMAAWNSYQKLEKIKQDLEQQTRQEASVEQIAKIAKVSVDKVQKTYEAAKLTQVYSLHQPTQNEIQQTGEASWSIESISNPLEDAERLELTSEFSLIHRVVGQFDDEERLIFGLISGCFDLLPPDPLNSQEILQEKIRQQAARAGIGLVFK